MPDKEEVLRFVQEKLDKAKNEDWIISMKQSKDRFAVVGKRIGAMNAEELINDC